MNCYAYVECLYSFRFWAVLQKCVYVPVRLHHVHFPYAKLNKLSKTSYMRFGLYVTWQRLQANTCSCKADLHSFNFQSCMFQLSLHNQTLCLFRPSELDGVICWAVFLVLCCWQPWIIQINWAKLFICGGDSLSPTPPPSVLSSPLLFFPPSFSIAHTSVGKNPSPLWFRCSGGYKEQQTRSLSLSSVLQ